VDFRWKPVEVIALASLTARQVTGLIYDQIRLTATDAGDFVQQIEVGGGRPCGYDSTKWTAFYLPGPPGRFPQQPGNVSEPGKP
jgi:hypothetical protein